MLGDTNPKKIDKKQQTKRTVFAKHLADVFQPHAQFTDKQILGIPRIASSISWTLRTNHAKANKRNKTLKYEKTPGIDLVTPKMLKELIQKDVILLII